jgi:cbb3-type cytochrome oxidase maturation protein
MAIMVMLILFSLLVAGGFLFAFIWAVRDGQFDDSYTPSLRVLFEDDTQFSKVDNPIESKSNVSEVNQVLPILENGVGTKNK